MDFFQNGTITTLHKLRQRPIEEIEAELNRFSMERPMALILPCLYSELEGMALPRIVEDLEILMDGEALDLLTDLEFYRWLETQPDVG